MAYATKQEARERKPVRWWHEWIIDDMLMYPRDTIPERARRLKYSPTYLSLCMHSDMFKALYTERRAAYSARLHEGIADKTAEAANKALDLVIESLDKKRDKIPFAELSEFTDRTLERLGYGVKQNGSQVNVQVNTTPSVTKEQLADARRDLRAIEDQREKTIEAIPLPSEPTQEGP
jgi:hypothetical protein